MPRADPRSADPPGPAITTAALTPDRWDDAVAVFGTRGDPSWCWCEYLRSTGRGYQRDPSHNRAELLRLVTEGRFPPGLLAYAGPEPVGWVAVAPRTAYPRVGADAALAALTGDIEDPAVWTVGCFVVRVGHRRRGVGAALLGVAVEFARGNGARVVEGHPVDVAARGRRTSAAELYHGAASSFTKAGFAEVGRTGPSRPVMRLQVTR